MSIEGTYLNIIKAKYDKPTTKILLSGEKLENISSEIRNKGTRQGYPLLPQLFTNLYNGKRPDYRYLVL